MRALALTLGRTVFLDLSRHVAAVLQPIFRLQFTPTTDLEVAEAATRKDLAATYRMLDKWGLNEGVCNHLTALLPGTTDRFLVIRYGLRWSEVTPENLVLLDASGTILQGEGPVEVTAFEIHRAIHLADPVKYACVLHTHMPYATTLCCIGGESSESEGVWPGLLMCHQNSTRFHRAIAYDEQFNGLVTDSTEGERLAAAMKGLSILFHRSHGVIVCGRTVAEAFDDLYYLERAAQQQVLAMSTGRPLTIVRDEVCAGTKACFDAEKLVASQLHLDAWQRQLADEDAAAIGALGLGSLGGALRAAVRRLFFGSEAMSTPAGAPAIMGMGAPNPAAPAAPAPNEARASAASSSPPLALFFGPAKQFRGPIESRLRTDWLVEDASDDPKLLLEQARAATALVGGLAQANDLLRSSGPCLKVMQCHFTGTDWLEPSALPSGVTLCNATGMEQPIAEWALASMLQTTVRLPLVDKEMRKRCADAAESGRDAGFAPPFFRPNHPHPDAAPMRSELTGATVGIVGYGTIGHAISVRAVACGMKVAAVVGRKVPPACPPELARLDGRDGLERLLATSDYVVLACSLNESTKGLLGAAQLGSMKPSAMLINVARGGVVDEAALYAALTHGTIAHAALDVWWGWPDVGNGQRECAPYDLQRHPFHTLPNVHMSNHTSGWSDQQLGRRYDLIAANLDRLVRGEPLQSVVLPPS